MGNEPSQALGDARLKNGVLPRIALIVEKWINANNVSEAGTVGEHGMPTCVVFIDNVEITRVIRYPSDPIQISPKKMSANLRLRFYAKVEEDKTATASTEVATTINSEATGEIIITLGKLLQFGLPLYTSLCLGVSPPPKGRPTPVDVKESLRNAARGETSKVLITLFRPMQVPGAGSRIMPDVKQALVADGMDWCAGPSEQEQTVTASGQVQGLIDCIKCANTTLIAMGNKVSQLEQELELVKDDEVMERIQASRGIKDKDVEEKVRDATRDLEAKVRELEIERDTLKRRLLEYEDRDKAFVTAPEQGALGDPLLDNKSSIGQESVLSKDPSQPPSELQMRLEAGRRRAFKRAEAEKALLSSHIGIEPDAKSECPGAPAAGTESPANAASPEVPEDKCEKPPATAAGTENTGVAAISMSPMEAPCDTHAKPMGPQSGTDSAEDTSNERKKVRTSALPSDQTLETRPSSTEAAAQPTKLTKVQNDHSTAQLDQALSSLRSMRERLKGQGALRKGGAPVKSPGHGLKSNMPGTMQRPIGTLAPAAEKQQLFVDKELTIDSSSATNDTVSFTMPAAMQSTEETLEPTAENKQQPETDKEPIADNSLTSNSTVAMKAHSLTEPETALIETAAAEARPVDEGPPDVPSFVSTHMTMERRPSAHKLTSQQEEAEDLSDVGRIIHEEMPVEKEEFPLTVSDNKPSLIESQETVSETRIANEDGFVLVEQSPPTTDSHVELFSAPKSMVGEDSFQHSAPRVNPLAEVAFSTEMVPPLPMPVESSSLSTAPGTTSSTEVAAATEEVPPSPLFGESSAPTINMSSAPMMKAPAEVAPATGVVPQLPMSAGSSLLFSSRSTDAPSTPVRIPRLPLSGLSASSSTTPPTTTMSTATAATTTPTTTTNTPTQ